MNPYAQGGQWTSHRGGQPSIYGALPFSSPPSGPNLVLFTFHLNHSVLNSEVVGPNDRVYYRIATDATQNMFTAIHSSQQPNVGRIEWRPTTTLEFDRAIPRQRAAEWVRVDNRSGARQMMVAGRPLAWVADDSQVFLQTIGSHPEFIARVTRHSRYVTLEIVAQALSQPGLLESCIMATILFQSGRDIH